MSSNLRRFGSLSLIAIGAQALAFGALAQTTAPENTPDTTRQSAGATSTTTGTGTSADATGARSDRAAQPTQSSAKNTQMANVTPESFASKAAVLSTAEVELSQLALNNTKNEEIRIFAERMIKDHTAANEKLKKIAAQENITVPQSLDAEHRAVKQKLASLKGDAFDREYRKEMAKGHDKAVALFESASQNEQMPEELREFAASTLRTLEDHQEDAHDMHEDAMEEGA